MAMASDNATGDLNQVISSAVQARIETEVAAALSGSELMSQYVAAALRQKIDVKADGGYRTRETTFLRETIDKAIQSATKAAVAKVIVEEAEAIEAAVATEIRRGVKDIAKRLTTQLAEKAAEAYGVTVELKYPKDRY
jgi:deoxyribose-phosphate aldolase